MNQTPLSIRADWEKLASATVIDGVWTRTDDLGIRERRIISLSILMALNLPHEFALHLRMAFRQGFTSREVGELIMHAAIYAGFPKAVEAMRVAAEVIEELGIEDLDPAEQSTGAAR
jgi:4-carboxymuconolactone decarboxylase